jgi:type II secretory pathway pseudopilin PulG
MRTPRTHRPDSGTVLLMFPAAVLIMFLLGAIVVDVALTQVRARELEAVAASAANDALAALDIAALRSGDGIVITEADARIYADESVAAGPIPDARVAEVVVGLDARNRTVIAVTLTLDVNLVMAPSVGNLDRITLRRTERAVILGSAPP